MGIAFLLGGVVGGVSMYTSALARTRAPLATIEGPCHGVEFWPESGPFEAPRGEDGRRSSVSFVRHDDRATVELILDAVGDDSVESEQFSYALAWSPEHRAWRVTGCQRRVLACYRGMPPVCS